MASLLSITGLAFLVLAMVGAMFLVTDFLFGSTAATVALTLITALLAYVWFVIPIRYRPNHK